MQDSNKGWFASAKQAFNRLIGNQPKPQSSQKQQTQPNEHRSSSDEQFVDGVFTKVSKMIKSCSKLSTQQQLTLYGLFKQATEGDNNKPKPAFYQMQASAKYGAWEKCRGMSKLQAKELYVKYANSYDATIGQKLIEALQNPDKQIQAVETAQKQNGMLGTGSRPQTGPEPEYSHPYIQAMIKSQPIKINKALLLKMNDLPQILPLHYAIDNELVDYVRQFVQALDQSQINLPDGEGMTAIQYAELIDNAEILQTLQLAIPGKKN